MEMESVERGLKEEEKRREKRANSDFIPCNMIFELPQ
jgi:hypothetical protein